MKPKAPTEDAARPAALTFMNCRRVTAIVRSHPSDAYGALERPLGF
jgi:hypothetical protein